MKNSGHHDSSAPSSQSSFSLDCRIDRMCDEFGRNLRSGKEPRIEDFLTRLPEEAKSRALQGLIPEELEYRAKIGQQVTERDFLSRFPDQPHAVRAAFKSWHDDRLPLTHSEIPRENARDEALDMGEQAMPQRIGRYVIRNRLGQGGFAVVYRAHDPDLSREVALKLPRLERFSSREDLDRFLHEARAAAQLDHPGIVRIYDVYRDSSTICIVQEYVSGENLKSWVRAQNGTPDVDQVTGILIHVADALSYAHQKRIYHRDLKPDNLMLDANGRPRIVDFGLALQPSLQSLRRGEIAGTPIYMSPEQVRGEAHRLDGRSDVFSLGVVLYEILTGSRPFSGESFEKLADEIKHREPIPLRQLNPALPPELERICLKCLSKLATDRYSSAADLAVDLRHWRDDHSSQESTLAAAPTVLPVHVESLENQRSPVRIVPKGLRAFDDKDSEFFLDLVPGPRDRNGLPESIRFWKNRVEETDSECTFSVGLIYGPSGCGKSSLVRAGLLPQLSESVLHVYVEATSTDTETRLLRKLQRHCSYIDNETDITSAFARLRESEGCRGRKVLVVLDQFEQWLHSQVSGRKSDLVDALRQCNGSRVQTILLVRDDFAVAVHRLFRSLEIRLVENDNYRVVDLFDQDHARRVLTALGVAYGRLPGCPGQISSEQTQFLDQSIEMLSQNGKVICVRLALFADMVKGRPWTVSSLREAGGFGGIGVQFLNETFSLRSAPPEHQFHEKAAQKVLNALLPKPVDKIKGTRRSCDDLIAASGYSDRRDFDQLIQILDNELRLITPVDPEDVGEVDQTSATASDKTFYQLTHDYLVRPLRTWLNSKEAETRSGRARLRLIERSDLWNAKPENRYLPSALEWARIYYYTRKSDWTSPQRKMMRRARHVHSLHYAVTLFVLLVMGFLGQWTMSRLSDRDVKKWVEVALTSSAEKVPEAVRHLESHREHAVQVFQEIADNEGNDLNSRFRAIMAIGMLGRGLLREHHCRLMTRAIATGKLAEYEVDKEECVNIVSALRSQEELALRCLHHELALAEQKGNWRCKARLAIVALNLGDSSVARNMFRIDPDPTQRTVLIDTFPLWHGDLEDLALIVEHEQDPAFRSGMSLAVGNIRAEVLNQRNKEIWTKILKDWHTSAEDAGTHSAAAWALRCWSVDLTTPPSTRDPIMDRDWFVNSLGMTMIRIPAGPSRLSSDRGDDARNGRLFQLPSFYLCNHEVTVRQFRHYLEDSSPEKSSDWRRAYAAKNTQDDCPVRQVSWNEAIQFCNWLSRKEERGECYHQEKIDSKANGLQRSTDTEWEIDLRANGYRLPTEVEWEYSCRAHTTTDYACGGTGAEFLKAYAVCGTPEAKGPSPCGSKMPNAWGLFDMHGNLAEWCQDSVNERFKRFRGGSYADIEKLVRSGFCLDNDVPGRRDDFLGFRVARSQ